MSLNPLQEMREDISQYYNPDIHGPRKFIVDSNERNLEFVRSVFNDKLKPLLIDFETLKISDPKYLGMKGDVQRVAFQLEYKDPLGKPHKQRFNFERHGLREVLLTRLPSEDYWLNLPCVEWHPFGILLAIEKETGVKLSLEDVMFFDEGNGLMQMESRFTSYGWYGDVYLRLVK